MSRGLLHADASEETPLPREVEEFGLCRLLELPTSLFYPERGCDTRTPKAICMECDVRQQCLDFALSFSGQFGVWGGLSERERRRLKKKLREERE